jgi:hypothetical protein
MDNSDLKKLILYAILAPSPRNSQPWKFLIENNKIRLYFDITKALPALDPNHRESYIALGAALENLLIAAKHFNYNFSVDYFPEGKTNNEEIAAVELEEKKDNESEDELFYIIEKRNTNRNPYALKPVHQDIVDEFIQIAINGNTHLYFIKDQIVKSLMAYVAMQATQKEYEDESIYRDLYSTLRFSEPEAKQKGDGLEVKGLARRLVTKYLYHWKILPWLNMFGISKTLSLSSKKLLERTPIIGLLTSKEVSNLEYVKGGQIWERIALTACKYGLSTQPVSAPLELPEFDTAVRTLFHTGSEEGLLILFRLGYGPPARNSQRRNIEQVIVKKNS